MNPTTLSTRRRAGFGIAAAILALVLIALFHRSFVPGETLFSNDGPLGAIQAQADHAFGSFRGLWMDLNWIGSRQPEALPNLTQAIYLLTGHEPVLFSKIYAPVSLFILGLCIWVLFRRLGFNPAVSALGALAASLNMNVFSNACWGLPTRALTLGCVALAIAALSGPARRHRWIAIPLAGFSLGLALMEGYDVAAIFSLYIAAYGLFHAAAAVDPWPKGILRGAASVALVAVCAAWISAQALSTLVQTQVKGVVGIDPQKEDASGSWDWATQWSLPKLETLRVIVPGLFGYRMDTPDGGNYWGTVGRHPGWEEHRQGFPRHSGSGEYAGIFVVLAAIWAAAQALRGPRSPYPERERRLILFWSILAIVSLVLAYGRHAPFYRIVYALPYFSTIRNPIKFMHPFHLCVLVLFGYGLQDLWRRFVERPQTSPAPPKEQLRRWWASAAAFDRRWFMGGAAALAFSLLGWLIYSSSPKEMIRYLTANGIDPAQAAAIHQFSVYEAGLAAGLLALSLALLVAIAGGLLSGHRARWAAIAAGSLLVIDLGRANLPWITYYNYQEKYASNPVVDILRDKPWERRVTLWAYPGGESFTLMQQWYSIEWLQQLFPFYRIHSLDVVQEPRESADNRAYRGAFSRTNLASTIRLWELSNTRFLVAPGGDFIPGINQQFDADRQRFRLHTPYDIAARHANATRLEDLTTAVRPEGRCALVEFTGALPRAAIYSHWQVSTNDDATLRQLADPAFDPHRSVLVADNIAAPTAPAENGPPATNRVTTTSYSSMKIRMETASTTPAILLLNDKHDPNWKVFVDDRPAPLLRCNFIMRGVEVPAGTHCVEWRFEPPMTPLIVSLTAWAAALACLILLLARRSSMPAAGPPPPPHLP